MENENKVAAPSNGQVERDGGMKLRKYQRKSKEFVDAKSARNLAETSSALKNHIAKLIRDESEEGRTMLDYCIWGVCGAQVNSVTEELRGLGYTVDVDPDVDELHIRW